MSIIVISVVIPYSDTYVVQYSSTAILNVIYEGFANYFRLPFVLVV